MVTTSHKYQYHLGLTENRLFVFVRTSARKYMFENFEINLSLELTNSNFATLRVVLPHFFRQLTRLIGNVRDSQGSA